MNKFSPGDRVIITLIGIPDLIGKTGVVTHYKDYSSRVNIPQSHHVCFVRMDDTGVENGFYEFRLELIEDSSSFLICPDALEEVLGCG